MIKNTAAVLLVLIISWLTLFSNFRTAGAAVYRRCAAAQVAADPQHRYASDNVSIKIPTNDGKIISLDKKNLEYLWKTELGGKIVSDVIQKKRYLYVITKIVADDAKNVKDDGSGKNENSGGAVLWMLDEKTGLIIRKLALGQADEYYVSDFGDFINVSDSLGEIRFYTSDLELKNKFDSGLPISLRPLTSKEELFFAGDRKLYKLSRETNRIQAILEQLAAISEFRQFSATQLVLGDYQGNLILFETDKRRVVWKFRAGGQITNLAVFSGRILAASADGFIYFLNKNGSLLWKHRLSGRISGGIFSINDDIMFGLPGEKVVNVLDLKKGAAINGPETDGEPYLPAADSDDPQKFLVFNTDRLFLYSIGQCS